MTKEPAVCTVGRNKIIHQKSMQLLGADREANSKAKHSISK